MPQTLCPRVPWLQHLSNRELRDEADMTHWNSTDRWFNWFGFSINTMPDNGTESKVDHEQQAKFRTIGLPPMLLEKDQPRKPTVDQLSPKSLRSFCFKDCMVYTVNGCGKHWWLSDLHSRIYRRWYPSRAQDLDINYQNFFCQLAGFWAEKEVQPGLSSLIAQIVAFHKLLCQTIEAKVTGLPDPEPLELENIDPSHSVMLPPVLDYVLRPTFSKCFLIFHDSGSDLKSQHDTMFTLCPHPKWGARTDTGAVVVWLHAEDAIVHSDEMTAIVGEGIPEQVRAYQCKTLECAMQSVLLTTGDPERISPKQEWHGRWQEVLDQRRTEYSSVCRHCLEYEWIPNSAELQLYKYSPPLHEQFSNRA